MKITLTEKENKIFDILCNVCDYIKEKGKEKPTLRIAGGWVRDKVSYHNIQKSLYSIIINIKKKKRLS